MLETIFGSKSRQKILIFLFVNGKCYGAQLQRLLTTPLTPIQTALLRLEKAGIVSSYFEGKTRVYQFDPSFPLLDELETLLKKAYTLLPPQEKKMYNSIALRSLKASAQDAKEKILLTCWEKLSSVKHLFFNAKTKSKLESGWNGKGKGEVLVTKEGENVLIFSEKGSWKGEKGKDIDFSNTFRWTLDRSAKMISLEHLRRGPQNPVFLFHLAPSGSHSLASIDSHFCEEDAYFGQIFYDLHCLRLNWRVIGPKKNEELDYYYT
ncbi:MAG TPA: DUF6314 family protein [Rhabdochlamydiaceae bacterium]|nr:DUF6314 family protein [Rhabdochlamydiaceae bacterium]